MSKQPTGKEYGVWTWTDEHGSIRFIGWGPYSSMHPAKARWQARNAYECELNTWLRTLEEEPHRRSETPAIPLYRDDARGLATMMMQKVRKEGVKLLASRPDGTKAGGGNARIVMDPDFKVFDSVREAAEHYGVNPCTITRWCKDYNTGWDYIT